METPESPTAGEGSRPDQEPTGARPRPDDEPTGAGVRSDDDPTGQLPVWTLWPPTDGAAAPGYDVNLREPVGDDGGAAAPPQRLRRRALAALALAALVATSGGAGAAIAVFVHDQRTAASGPLLPATGGSSGPGSDSGGSAGSGVAPTGGIDGNAIADRVDPALVDINTQLAGGGAAAGTGMILTSTGVVLTNNHVIADATSITAQVGGTGRTYRASVVGYDVSDDVAVLQLQGASGLKTVSVGNSGSVSVGDPVVAIGNARGQGGVPTATEGAVTALNRTITVDDSGTAQTLSGLIEVDASIQPGDSGGPLLDAGGRVIGMNTAAAYGGRFFRSQTSSAGYAIPVDNAVSVAQQIRSGRSGGKIHTGPRAVLGVEVTDVGAGLGGRFGGFGGFGGGDGGGAVPATNGALVAGVDQGTPAASTDLTAGDVIVAVDGTAVDSAGALSTALAPHRVGDSVTVTWVDRSGAQHSASVRLAAGPPA